MKTRYWLRPIVLAAAVLCSCSGPDEPVSTAVHRQALNVPGLVPKPCDPVTHEATWDGDEVDLMVADAWTSCSYASAASSGNPTILDGTMFMDAYLTSVHEHMVSAMDPACGANPNHMGRWAEVRANANCNVDANGQVRASPIVPTPLPAPIDISYTMSEWNGGWPAAQDMANIQLRLPQVNLCIALKLREVAPGAMGVEALLLPAAQQIELLEVVKERVQIAMLQFAQLGVVFAAPPDPDVGDNLDPGQYMPVLQRWAHNNLDPVTLERLGQDFGTAVALHRVVSSEIAEMLARSGSAGAPRGGHAQSAAAEQFGPGAWRQRAMASLYGGDPLAQEKDGSSPWLHPFGKTSPSVEGNMMYGELGWPNALESPYVQTSRSSPQPGFLLGLVRAADAVLLSLVNNPATGCMSADVEATAVQMYRRVEADLQTKQCEVWLPGLPGSCVPVTIDQVPEAVDSSFKDFLLYRRYRISPDDARVVARTLAELLEPLCQPGTGDPAGRPGALDLSGTLKTVDPGAGYPPGSWAQLNKDFKFLSPPLANVAPLYTKFSSQWRLQHSWELHPRWPAQQQGFCAIGGYGVLVCPADEAKRTLGSVSALAAVRQALVEVETYRTMHEYGDLDGYLKYVSHSLKLVSASVGEGQVTLRPVLRYQGMGGENPTVIASRDGDDFEWEVGVVTGEADQQWIGLVTLIAIPSNTWAGVFAARPESEAYGENLQSAIAQGIALAVDSNSAPVLGSRLRYFYLDLPPQHNYWTFVLRKGVGQEARYSLLASRVRVIQDDTNHGQYLAYRGTLGLSANRLLERLEADPSLPAYDGFGYAIDWVPPTNPALFGGPTGGSAITHYLARAKESAGEATVAVSQAMDGLLEQETDSAARLAADTMSSRVAEMNKRSLCGDSNPSCDTSLVPLPVSIPGSWPSDCTAPPSDTERIRCMVREQLEAFETGWFIANEVFAHVNDPAPPAFENYSGGSLQRAFIEQWEAVRQVNHVADVLVKAMDGAVARLENVASHVALLDKREELNCGPAAMALAWEAGHSWTESDSTGFGLSGGFPSGITVSGSTSTTTSDSHSLGPLIAQQLKCAEIKAEIAASEWVIIAAGWEAITEIAGHASQLTQASKNLRLSTSTIGELVLEAELSKTEADMQGELLRIQQTTSFGLYQRYHNYDVWRAKALLENARRYAVVARRAIESQYLVNLSSLRAPEPFVTAPNTWADEVYSFDLSMPASVGLSVGNANTDGIYPNKVLDYVGNLERFVDGFAVERPTAVANEDKEIVSLPGMEVVMLDNGNGTPMPSCPKDSASYGWAFHCPIGDSWVNMPDNGDATSACGTERPDYARIQFTLDAWGRLDMDIAHEPFAKRYNARWTRFAVNLVGTGLRDCDSTSDPQTCYAEPFLRFNLSHVGPSWVNNFDEHWRALATPTGRSEGGKALAAELWLDPTSNGWSDNQLQSVVRSEFQERPFWGTYELVLQLGGEVRLNRLEKVQILIGSTYWLKQK